MAKLKRIEEDEENEQETMLDLETAKKFAQEVANSSSSTYVIWAVIDLPNKGYVVAPEGRHPRYFLASPKYIVPPQFRQTAWNGENH